MTIKAVVEISSIDSSVLKGTVSIYHSNGHPLDEPTIKIFYGKVPAGYPKSVGLIKSTAWTPELSSSPPPSILELEALYEGHKKALYKDDEVKLNPLAEFFK